MRRWSLSVAITLAATLGLFAAVPYALRNFGHSLFGAAHFAFVCEAPVVAITIDDGPDPDTTPAIVEVLARHNAKATFFVIGERARRHPALVEQIHNAGHELANHTFHDARTVMLADGQIEASIRSTHDELSRLQDVRWLRAGSAFYNSAVLEISGELDYQIVIGDVFPYDTLIRSSKFHAWYLQTMVRPGSVVVLHDVGHRGRRTAKALDEAISELRRRGFSFLTLTQISEHEGCGAGGRA